MPILYGLSLTQPWATFMALGYKSIETRSWGPAPDRLGQLVAIHAAKAMPLEVQVACLDEPFASLLSAGKYWMGPREQGGYAPLPRGLVVAVGRLTGRVKIGKVDAQDFATNPVEYSLGDFTPGRWAWIFKDIVPLATPVPLRGQPQLWEIYDGPDKDAILDQAVPRGWDSVTA